MPDTGRQGGVIAVCLMYHQCVGQCGYFGLQYQLFLYLHADRLDCYCAAFRVEDHYCCTGRLYPYHPE